MQRYWKWAFALAAVLPVGLSVASAAELPFAKAIPDRIIWVSPDGSDANTGGLDSPLRSVQLAVDRAAPGTAILLKPGSYSGNFKFQSIQGTAEKPIWLAAAEGPGTATIVAVSNTTPVISIFGEDNLIIRDLSIAKGSAGIQVSQSGTNYTNLANNILIEGNTITGSAVDGLKISQTNNIHIVNNIIKGVGGEGIDLVGVTGPVISGNEISNAASTSAGLFVKGGSSDIVITNNYIHSVAGDGLLVGGWTSKGSFLPGTSFEAKNVVVTGNVVEFAGKRPLAVLGGRDVDIFGNKFGTTSANQYSVAIGPGSPELSPPPPSSNVSIHDNVFEWTKYFSQVISGSTNIAFSNNIKNGVVDGDMRTTLVPHSDPLASALPADLLAAFAWPASARTTRTITGTSGADTLTGTTANEYLAGGSGADTMKAGAGDDAYEIGSSKDAIVENSGQGADNALVWTSSYTLTANVENLTVKVSTGGVFTGNSLNNILMSGRGNDVLKGGAGDNLFVFAQGRGQDTIADFKPGLQSHDTVDLTAFTGLVKLADVLALASQAGANTVLTFAGGETLTLANVAMSDLVADDFLLTRVPPPPNTAPTNIAVSNATVAEDAAVGTLVGTLSATDPDENETFAYTLVDNASGLFAVDGANLIVAGAFDFETAASHALTVRVTDSASNVYDQALTISVTDVAEEPPPPPPSELTTVSTILSGARVSAVTGGTVILPASSIARASDAGRFVHTNHVIFQPAGVASPEFSAPPAAGRVGPPVPGYRVETPASLACIYGLTAYVVGCDPNQLTARANGGSRVVVVTIAFHYPGALADLRNYSRQFGLPLPNLQVVTLGSPPVDSGWNLEAALDLAMIHAMAPDAKLVLVEARSNSIVDMLAAVDVGRTYVLQAGGGQVNGSWGSNEFSSEQSLDSHFTGNKVVYFFSSGDNVAPSWPAVSSRVVAVGGTSTPRNASGLYTGFETTWTEAGVGPSAYIARPSFQNGVASKVGPRRSIPDISADANPATGVWVYYNGGWYIVGGTSVSSPMVAGMVNRARKFRANSEAQNAFMYANVGTAAFFHDVGRGRCGTALKYTTTVGAKAAAWDRCTGIGSPKGAAGL